MAATYNLALHANNNPDVVLRFPFDLDGLVAILSLRQLARRIAHDYRSDDPASGLTIETSVDADGRATDPPGERRMLRWHYGIELTLELPRYETITWWLDLCADGTRQTIIAGNLIVEGGSDVQ